MSSTRNSFTIFYIPILFILSRSIPLSVLSSTSLRTQTYFRLSVVSAEPVTAGNTSAFAGYSSTNSLQIYLPLATRKQAAALFRGEKFKLLRGCLTRRHLVFTVLPGKSLELSALVTLLARLPVNYRQLSRISLAV